VATVDKLLQERRKARCVLQDCRMLVAASAAPTPILRSRLHKAQGILGALTELALGEHEQQALRFYLFARGPRQ
jgi:hypothetical protein